MTWIKICGITDREDALTAVRAGADALGFVFCEKSPRYVAPDTARQIVAELPANVEKVGVFVSDSTVSPADTAEQVGLTALQFHLVPGAAPRDPQSPLGATCAAHPRKWYLAVPAAWFLGEGPVKANLSAFANPNGSRNTIFLDSGSPDRPGGTGKPFDWQKAISVVEELKRNLNVVIAGGLNPENVVDAMRILKPWGVDVASGVEDRPGKKDPEKVRAFIAAVREADRSA
jgi:phosphoribosylanthranilate isomerase